MDLPPYSQMIGGITSLFHLISGALHGVTDAMKTLHDAAPIGTTGMAFLVGGAAAGTFGTYVYRLPMKHGIVSPQNPQKIAGIGGDSFGGKPETRGVCVCDSCRTPIGWRSQAPIVGWLWTMGKCPTCGSRASVSYPIMETLTAIATAGVFYATGSIISLTMPLFVLFIAWLDWQTEWIPDFLTLPLFLLGLAVSVFGLSPISPTSAILGAIICSAGWLSICVLTAFMTAIRQGRERGVSIAQAIDDSGISISVGDVTLVGAIGAWVGKDLALPMLEADCMVAGLALLASQSFAAFRERGGVPGGPFLGAVGAVFFIMMYVH